MQSILPIALFALGGVLLGGAWSIKQQSGSRALIVGFVVLAVVAVLGGIAWLLPKGTF
ncbi:hypothetical protein Athai_24810 [Actinocatenispora thailandica]|uniref:Uncharacterized protein n=1 Tax=Actinocatenispora thailandica TaxID=227318 RepID=A0A7R7DNN4_9ACTN|nr:hypothetical protein [Actinocatenispora thailandica]BCJ34978.1 hypothetical protein Athai_24810 [Actinocatenispora thailandica]